MTYDNGGGTSIGGLTDDNGTTKYYVIKLADGKIQLATSLANAEAGTAIDLTDQGSRRHPQAGPRPRRRHHL